MSTQGKVQRAETWEERERRIVRAMDKSGRRLVRSHLGWGVLQGADMRRRRVLELTEEDGARLVASGRVVEAASGPGYVLADRPEREDAPRPGPQAFHAVGVARRAAVGTGFIGLARRAEAGDGPLSLRAAAAGLRLVRDAETSLKRPGLTMNWDAIPADRGRRTAGDSGLSGSALAAEKRLARVAARIGRERYALAWAACVEGASLSTLAARSGSPVRNLGNQLAEVLEDLADAYDAGG